MTATRTVGHARRTRTVTAGRRPESERFATRVVAAADASALMAFVIGARLAQASRAGEAALLAGLAVALMSGPTSRKAVGQFEAALADCRWT